MSPFQQLLKNFGLSKNLWNIEPANGFKEIHYKIKYKQNIKWPFHIGACIEVEKKA